MQATKRTTATYWSQLRLSRVVTEVRRDDEWVPAGAWTLEAGYSGDEPSAEGSSRPGPDGSKLVLKGVHRETVDAGAGAAEVDRLAGGDRISTAVAISRSDWDRANTVLLARADDYPDALAAGALAADLDAPLLLTPSDALPEAVAEEIERLGVDELIVLGGRLAVSERVAAQVEALGGAPEVSRLAGADRYETAGRVAVAAGAPSGVVAVASGANFPDALAAGSLASRAGVPVILTAPDGLPEGSREALAELDPERVLLLGGVAAVGSVVAEALEAEGYQVDRLSGPTRYETGLAVVDAALAEGDGGDVAVVAATAQNFPDALAAGALAARRDGVVLLVAGDGLPSTVGAFVRARRDRFSSSPAATIAGGTAAVSGRTETELRAALNGTTAQLPPVTYDYRLFDNRVSNAPGIAKLPVPRLTGLTTELGGQVTYSYGQPRRCDRDTGDPGSYVRRTDDCFPSWVDQEPEAGPSDFALFHKYVVLEQRRTDGSGNEPEVTTFQYGAPAYGYSDEPGLPNVDGSVDGSDLKLPCPCRIWSDFRGHESVRVTDANGVTEHRFHLGLDGDRADSSGRSAHSASVELSDGTTRVDAYPLRGRPLEVRRFDPDGRTLRYRTVMSYEQRRTVEGPTREQVTVPQGAWFVAPSVEESTWTGTDPRSTRTLSAYDEYGNLLTSVSEGDVDDAGDDRTSRTTYVANPEAWIVDRPSTQTLAGADGEVVRRSEFGYDDQPVGSAPRLGNPTLERNDETATESHDTLTTYDALGRPSTVTDANGHSVTTSYHPVHGYAASVTNELGHVARYENDPRFGVPVLVVDPDGEATSATYDGFGRLDSVWLPTEDRDGPATYRYDYASDQRPAAVTTRQLAGDGAYLETVVYHDGFGREVQTQSPGPSPATRSVGSSRFDAAGLLQRESAPYEAPGRPGSDYVAPDWSQVANYQQSVYDALGVEVLAETLSRGTVLWSETTQVDAWTRRHTGREGERVDESFDAYDRLASTVEHDGSEAATTVLTYDAADDVVSSTDPSGHTTTIAYDLMGWKRVLEDPDTGRSTYDYDAVGNVTSQTDARGQTLAFAYDGLNRLVERRAESPDGPLLASYAHDADGSIGQLASTTSTTPLGEVTVAYAERDARQRVTRQEWSVPGPAGGRYAMAWAYDPNDVVTSVTYPGDAAGGLGETVVNELDGAGRVTAVRGDEVYAEQIAYDAQGRATGMALAGGVTRSFEYAPDTLRLRRIAADASGGSALQDLTYAYDRSANVTSITDGADEGQRRCFDYDDRSRLTRAFTGTDDCTSPDGARGTAPYDQAYGFAPDGNLTLLRGVEQAYDDDHPHAVAAAGSASFSYDDAGNQVTRTVDGSTSTAAYDADSRLSAITDADDALTRFAYDADGSRALRVEPDGAATVYLGGTAEVTVAPGGQRSLTSYYEVAGQPTVVRERSLDGEGGTLSLLLADHLGSVTAGYDTATGELERQAFGPWGEPLHGTAAGPGNRGFTGAVTDPSTGLVHLQSRYYDPLTGRFTQPDTIVGDPGDPETGNRYTYANDNPLLYTDPSGHFGLAGAIVGAAIGAVASYGAQVVSNVATNGFTTQAFTDVDLAAVGRATLIGAVGGATGGALALAGTGSTLAGTAGIGAVTGAVTGQVERATANVLEGRPATDGLLNPQQLFGDAVIGGVTAGIGRGVTSLRGTRAAAACAVNSFVATTPVLLPDGTQIPIEQVAVGDVVAATVAGETGQYEVEAVIVGSGEKHLVRVTLADGSSLTATAGHPVYRSQDGEFVDAVDLAPGDELRRPEGGPLVVERVDDLGVAVTTVYNLTVAHAHTYYAGTTPVLVHNASCGGIGPVLKGQAGINAAIAELSISHPSWQLIGREVTFDILTPNGSRAARTVRADLVYRRVDDAGNRVREIVEVKNGPKAHPTRNQREAYESFNQQPSRTTGRGPIARGAGLEGKFRGGGRAQVYRPKGGGGFIPI